MTAQSAAPALPRPFLEVSQRMGSDPMLVQGPGGNSSIKINGVMWIKASGTLLSQARSEEIFVAVDPVRARAEIDGEGDGTCIAALLDPECRLRPSIETTFHALLPQPVVFHHHSVQAICHLVSNDGRRQLEKALAGLNWLLVPYVRPGVPLTRAIRRELGSRRADIILLENHGVIVCGNDPAEVSDVIDEVERRLELPQRAAANPSVIPDPIPGWQQCPEAGFLALDDTAMQRAVSDSYYPDHVVFLGPGLATASPQQLAVDAGAYGPAVVVPRVGVFMRDDCKPAQRAMLRCLTDVLSRIPAGWRLRGLGAAAEAELLGWGAEKHRQKLARGI